MPILSAEDGLRAIQNMSGGECESFTTGIGSCFLDYEKFVSARFADDQACASCIAWATLTCFEVPESQMKRVD